MKNIIILAVAILGLLRVSTAQADWGNMFCDIMDEAHGASGLVAAVNLYNQDSEEDRACTTFIRHFSGMTASLHGGLEITQAPPAGYTKGTSIRRCFNATDGLVYNGQPYVEEGCPSLSNTAVVLDFSGYTADNGDCPIRIKSGAKVSIQKIKLIVKNPDKAICSYVTKTAVPTEDKESAFAWIHDVTVCAATDPNCNPAAAVDDDHDGVCNPGQTGTNCTGSDDCPNTPADTNVNEHGCPDADGDGVDDEHDTCPDTPEGTAVNEAGCPIGGTDDDGDGVCNPGQTDPSCTGSDNCPGTPAGTEVDANGCPTNDSDGDGVCNPGQTGTNCTGSDDCAGTPAGTVVDEHGCPQGTATDQDGDGILNGPDKCDKDSTADKCDSSNLAACFDNPVDNVCGGATAGSSIACSELDDMDNDGIGNRCDSDIDGDTLPNGSDPDPYDKDADNDGTDDNLDACPLNNERIAVPCTSTPVNPGDTDPDHDGLTTSLENDVLHTDPNNPDTDGDGFMDGVDCFPLDAAQHACGGTVVVVDPDTDNDGICDAAVSETDPVTGNPCTPNALGLGDNCPLVANADQKDTNSDGIGDTCGQGISPSLDGDGDGLPDDLEVSVFHTDPTKADTDGDGLSDSQEVNGMTYQGGRGPLDPDVDSDGICDGPAAVSDANGDPICTAGPNGTGDNCPIVENPGQEDGDGDGVGDLCQGDLDGDSKPDNEDNCPFVKNKDQKDSEEDGIGDACDVDLSASGFGAQGCGCRMDGQSDGRMGDMLPFLAMLLPVLMLRITRKRKFMS